MKNYFGRKLEGKGLSPKAEARVREIVREEIATQRSDAITVNSQEIGRAAIKEINELQRKTAKSPLVI